MVCKDYITDKINTQTARKKPDFFRMKLELQTVSQEFGYLELYLVHIFLTTA